VSRSANRAEPTGLVSECGSVWDLVGDREGVLQYVPRRARIPERAADERLERCVEMQYGELRCIRVSLRSPLASSKVECSGISDDRQIDGRDRPAKAGIRHVAGSAGHISQGGYVLIVVQESAENPYRLISGTLNGGRVTHALSVTISQRWQGLGLREITTEDGSDFGPNS
jgi:hypothetical protein